MLNRKIEAMEKVNFYTNQLWDYYKHPRHYGTLTNAHAGGRGYNPSCGDDIQVQVQIHQNELIDGSFTGSGCVISQASTSMILEHCISSPTASIMQHETAWVLSLIKLNLGPNRLRCALLGLEALQQAIGAHMKSKE
mgnify:CR=1 FL=1